MKKLLKIKRIALYALLAIAFGCADKPDDPLSITGEDGGSAQLEVSIEAYASSLPEGNVATFLVTSSLPVTSDLRVYLRAEGSATRTTDYDEVPTYITIQAGENRTEIEIDLLDDGEIETDEAVRISIESSATYTRSTQYVAEVTIIDNDQPGVSISVANKEFKERNGTITALLTLSGAAPYPIIVNLSTGGSCQPGIDYENFDPYVTIPAFQVYHQIPIEVIQDEIVEDDEDLLITILSGTGYQISGDYEEQITITDDDKLTVSLSLPASDVIEGEPTLFTLTFNKEAAADKQIFIYSSGTAKTPEDYDALPDTFTVEAGSITLDIPVTVLDDSIVEPEETIVLEIQDSPSYTLGTTFQKTLNIIDNDKPSVSVNTSVINVYEEGGPASIYFEMDRTAPYDVILRLDISGSAENGADVEAIANTLLIPSGELQAELLVDAISDSTVEMIETLTIQVLENELYDLGTITAANLSVVSGDLATMTVTSSISTIDESDYVIDYRITATSPSMVPLQIPLNWSGGATEGEDFEAAPRTVTLPAAQTECIFSLALVSDDLVEGNELLKVTLGEGAGFIVGTPALHEITILDDDNAVVQLSVSDPEGVIESAGVTTFTLDISNPVDQELMVPISVGGNASSSSDYNAIGTEITIPPNTTTHVTTIYIQSDTDIEFDETIQITIDAGPGYTRGNTFDRTITILDDDFTIISLSTPNDTLREGGTSSNIAFSFPSSAPYPLTVPLQFAGTAGNGTDIETMNSFVTIPANAPNPFVIDIEAVDDDEVELPETFIVSIINKPTNRFHVPAAQDTVNFQVISDDLPLVEFISTTIDLFEGETVGYFLRAVPASPVPLNLVFSIEKDGASDSDFAPVTSLTVPAGQTSQMMSFEALTDGLAEPDEYVTIRLADPNSNCNIGTNSTCYVTIRSTDKVVISFEDLAFSMNEGDPTLFTDIVLTQSYANAIPFTVIANVSAGNAAIPDLDYVEILEFHELPGTATRYTLAIQLSDDVEPEGIELISLELGRIGGTPADVVVGSNNVLNISIADNDLPQISLTGTTTSLVEGGTFSFNIKVDTAVPYPFDVAFTVGGTATHGTGNNAADDHNLNSRTVTIPAYNTTYPLTVNTIGDTRDEPMETIELTLTDNPTSYTLVGASTRTVQIEDNDVAEFSLTAYLGQTSFNEGAGEIVVAVRSTAPVGEAVYLEFETDGDAHSSDDYTGTVLDGFSVPANMSAPYYALLRIPLVDDSLVESTERLELALVANGHYTTVPGQRLLNLYISDNDKPVVSLTADSAPAEAEEGGICQYNLSIPTGIPYPLTVRINTTGSAQVGIDHSLSSTGYYTIPANTTSLDIDVPTTDDVTVENTETVILSIGASSAYTIAATSNSATYTVYDNDTPVVMFTQSTPPAGYYGQATVTLDQPCPYDLTLCFGFSVAVRHSSDSTVHYGTPLVFGGWNCNQMNPTWREGWTIPAGSTAVNFTIQNQWKYNSMSILLIDKDTSKYDLAVENSTWNAGGLTAPAQTQVWRNWP